MGNTSASVWNSLEVAKLLVSGLTPFALLVLGYLVSRHLKRVEQQQWSNQTVIEWKIKIYEQIAPVINDIYCYFMYIGDWKKVSPTQILAKKRTADKTYNMYRSLFSPEVDRLYELFIKCCFETGRGKSIDAGLRTGFVSRRDAFGSDWDSQWENLFVPVQSPDENRDLIHDSYSQLMSELASELGIPLNPRKTARPVFSDPEDQPAQEPSNAS